MKRTLLFLCIFLGTAFFGNCLQAQIYIYKIDKKVDVDGATIRAEGTRYYLFSGNKIFEVDKDGVKHKDLNGYNPYYKYKQSKSGNDYYYLVTYEPTMNFAAMTMGYAEKENNYEYLIVKSDKSKMNHVVVTHSSFGFTINGSTTVLSKITKEAIEKAKRDALPDMIE